ncbi:hypothetical protein E2C01_060601 [Portunus trituberculatus]|uniref:Uncharacterized protein n=1 Tax=Portunus trituberculatus TaxID=210409 RepID=A0A5B7H8J5_PORTR|nr:hypothetical protein [Portunus trituberculatus]
MCNGVPHRLVSASDSSAACGLTYLRRCNEGRLTRWSFPGEGHWSLLVSKEHLIAHLLPASTCVTRGGAVTVRHSHPPRGGSVASRPLAARPNTPLLHIHDTVTRDYLKRITQKRKENRSPLLTAKQRYKSFRVSGAAFSSPLCILDT